LAAARGVFAVQATPAQAVPNLQLVHSAGGGLMSRVIPKSGLIKLFRGLAILALMITALVVGFPRTAHADAYTTRQSYSKTYAPIYCIWSDSNYQGDWGGSLYYAQGWNYSNLTTWTLHYGLNTNDQVSSLVNLTAFNLNCFKHINREGSVLVTAKQGGRLTLPSGWNDKISSIERYYSPY
jgi:hypothetical protein